MQRRARHPLGGMRSKGSRILTIVPVRRKLIDQKAERYGTIGVNFQRLGLNLYFDARHAPNEARRHDLGDFPQISPPRSPPTAPWFTRSMRAPISWTSHAFAFCSLRPPARGSETRPLPAAVKRPPERFPRCRRSSAAALRKPNRPCPTQSHSIRGFKRDPTKRLKEATTRHRCLAVQEKRPGEKIPGLRHFG
jgi:hypothetical protein